MLGWLSLPQAHRVGTVLGVLLMALPTALKSTARRNISLCFNNLNEEQREALLRAHFVEFGKSICEVPVLWKSAPEVFKTVAKEVVGLSEFTRAVEQGKGIVIAAPHLGAWEFVGYYLSVHAPMTILYRPPQLRALDEPLRRARGRFGAHLVPTDKRGVRALLDALQRGEMVGILPDQDPGHDNGVFVPFFGVTANTMTLLTRLAMRTEAAVFVTFAERLPNAQGYRMHFKPVDFTVQGGVEQGVAALNHALEDAIRVVPEQYLWTYKRFKTRPPGERSLY